MLELNISNQIINRGNGHTNSSSDQTYDGLSFDAVDDKTSERKRKREGEDDRETLKKQRTLPVQEIFEYLENPFGYHKEPEEQISTGNWNIVPLPSLSTFSYPWHSKQYPSHTNSNNTNYPSSSENDNDIELMDLHDPEAFDLTLFYNQLQQQWLDRMEGGHTQENYSYLNRESQGQLNDQEKQERLEAAHFRAWKIVDSVNDTWELQEALRSELAVEHSPLAHLNKLDIVGLGTPAPRLVGQINPKFEVDLTNMEMRGVKVHTEVRWKGGTLTLDRNGNHTVGIKMQASRLSHDTLKGSESTADVEQKNWMNKLGGDTYFRGHLLNDNLGGPAHVYNLFPITQKANSKHVHNAEEYVKKGVAAGYIYEYSVDIVNIKETAVTGGQYAVDCDLNFNMCRLNAAGKIVDGTKHGGQIQSRGGKEAKRLFLDGDDLVDIENTQEYQTDFTGGKSNAPFTVKDEENIGAGILRDPDTTYDYNNFLDNVPLDNVTYNFVMDDIFITGQEQKLNTTAGKANNLKLHNSSENDIVAYFESLIDNWAQDDIRNWVRAIQTLNTWKHIKQEAYENHGLKKQIAEDLLNYTEMLKRKITIGTKVKNKPGKARNNDDSEDSEEYKHSNELIKELD